MNKETVAVDVDEVLFPFVPEFVQYDNDRYGGNLTITDFFTYRFEHVLEIPLEEAVERVYSFNAVDHNHISPVEAAHESIERLSERFNLVVVTARHPKFEPNTRRWLNEHLPGFFREVLHIGYASVMEKPQRKVDVCKQLGAIALIDDSLEHVSECAKDGVEGVLFGNYPWNQIAQLPAGVTRCLDWPAVLEYFDARG